MLFVLEMANNHQGSVDHAFKIIDEFSKLVKKYNINAGIKLQFRQLDSFIHKSFIDSDLKYVKRFRETRLSKEQFSKIIKKIKSSGLIAIATPFDNESLSWIEDLNVDIIKIASCSIDDWPLLRSVSKMNRKCIISTGGADYKTMDMVYNLFKKEYRDFSFMHCVGQYPTPVEYSNLNRIKIMKERYSDIEIGISTHESPDQKSIVSHAVAMGCNIIEKHVGVETDTISLNAYSCTSKQLEKVICEVLLIQKAMLGKSPTEKDSLYKLKRGIYTKRKIEKGDTISENDLYYAMPLQEGQACVADIDNLIGYNIDCNVEKDSPVALDSCKTKKYTDFMEDIRNKACLLMDIANIKTNPKDKLEISAHRGLYNFYDTGALIIDKINREYCKKLILMFPSQKHPTHHHIKKEEAFELLHGDCTLVLNGKEIDLKTGVPVLIARGVKHSFEKS